MLKRISILFATFVIIIGTSLGLISPASALRSPDPTPVNVTQLVAAHNAPEVYVVKSGDSLSAIAHKFHFRTWEKLYCKNRKVVGNKPWLIQPRMKLIIKETHNLCHVPQQQIAAPVVTTVRASPVHRNHIHTLRTTGTYTGGSSFQQCVIMAESGGDPTAYNPSSGASGLYGFLLSTWDSLGLGYPGGAYTAPVSVQNQGFEILYSKEGTAPWAPYDGC